MAGTCVAFLGSALLYDRYGITGSAFFGACLEASLLLGSLAYLALCASKQRAMQPQVEAAAATQLNDTNGINGHVNGHDSADGHAFILASGNNPFVAVADDQVVPDNTWRPTQIDAGIGADPLVLQLSRSSSLHSSQLTNDEPWLDNPLAQLLGSSFVVPEGSPVCPEDTTGGWGQGGDTNGGG